MLQGRLKAGWYHFESFTKKAQNAGGKIPDEHQAENSSSQAVKKAQKTPAQLPHTALLNQLIKSPTGAFPVAQLTC